MAGVEIVLFVEGRGPESGLTNAMGVSARRGSTRPQHRLVVLGGGPSGLPTKLTAHASRTLPLLVARTPQTARKRIRPANGFVDSTTDEILARLRADLAPALDAFVVNTDEGPPYYHVQTVGDVAAVDQHVEAEQFASDEAAKWREELSDKLEDHRDTKMWGIDCVWEPPEVSFGPPLLNVQEA